MQKTNTIYRLSKGTTNHYTSLEALREDWGMKQVSRKTTDEEKLKKQQTKFLGNCKVCGEPLAYISNTNTIVCTNMKCKGIEIVHKDETVAYVPVARILDEKGAAIAQTLFD